MEKYKSKCFLFIIIFLFIFNNIYAQKSNESNLSTTPQLTEEQIAKHPTDKWFTAKRPDFSQLDERIKGLAKNEESPEAVAKIVCQGLETDIEKARAIFDWIAYNIAYDTSYTLYKPYEVFKKRKGICQGYSDLYTLMAKEVGLDAIVVSGIGYGINRGAHAWNLVKLSDRDIMIDSCWGAGTIRGSKFTFNFTPEWFDTHPAVFAMRHLPNELKDERIYPPIDKKTFYKLPKIQVFNYYPYGNLDPMEDYKLRFCKASPNFPVTFSSYRNKAMYSEFIQTGKDEKDGFFIGSNEINLYTVKKFLSEEDAAPILAHSYEQETTSAATDIPLFLIAKLCNNLSESYGLEKCYIIPDSQTDQTDESQIVCDNSKFGLRLPTKKEWLFACGKKVLNKELSETEFSEYAQYDKNTWGEVRIVKQTKENEYNLCDMLGNVSELCFDEESGKYVFMGGNIFSTREELQALISVPYDGYKDYSGAAGIRLVLNAPKTPREEYLTASLYIKNSYVKKDKEKRMHFLTLASKSDYPPAIAELAEEYYWQFTPEGYKKAYELSKRAAEFEHYLGFHLLSDMYRYGDYVDKDEQKSFEYLKRSAELGYDYALYEIALCYKDGFGIQKDESEYFAYLNKYAQLNPTNEKIQLEIADCYRYGKGCPKDEEKALNKIREIFNSSYCTENGIIALGDYYAEGIGCIKDTLYAISLYERAEKRGSEIAKERLKQIKNKEKQ